MGHNYAAIENPKGYKNRNRLYNSDSFIGGNTQYENSSSQLNNKIYDECNNINPQIFTSPNHMTDNTND